MKTDNVKVIIRLRPLDKTEQRECVISKHSSKTVEVNRGLSNYTVRFSHVLSPEESQQHTFLLMEPSLQFFLEGKNLTILAYGQTGAGKTHTIIGKETRNGEFSGIIPRAISYIFTHINPQAELYCSLYEIYNDKIFDLLDMKKSNPLGMKDDSYGHSYIPDLLTIPVHNQTQVFNYLSLGLKNRKVRATEMNLESSRSHCIFQILHVQKEQTSRLRIVDLAGSEKFQISKNMKPEEKTAKIAELSAINKSLTALGQCVFALSQKKKGHIPYRNSKLTRVLRDSLEGNSDVILIACMSPSLSCINESLSTLRFAERAKRAIVEEKIPVERVLDVIEKERMEMKEMALKLKEYEAEIERLRDENQKLHNQLQKSRKVRWLSDINPTQINYDLHNELYRDDRIFDHVTFFNQNESIEEEKPIDIVSPVRKDESLSTSFISFTDPNLSWTSEAQEEPKNICRKFQSSFDIAIGSFKELINDIDSMKRYPRTPMK
jgi:hypothetical protein